MLCIYRNMMLLPYSKWLEELVQIDTHSRLPSKRLTIKFAGRPGYDVEGKVLVLTQQQTAKLYEESICAKKPLESKLHLALIEHLNSEIVLETIKDIDTMLAWASETFLWVRAKKTPEIYFPSLISSQYKITTSRIEQHIKHLMMQEYNKLRNAEPPFVMPLDRDALTFASTPLGAIMAKFCIAYETILSFRTIQESTSMSELIEVVSCAQEFAPFHCRNEHKKILENANKDSKLVRYKISKKSNTGGWTTPRKVNCLLQIAISSGTIENFTLRQEMQGICDTGCRVCEALIGWYGACVGIKVIKIAVKAIRQRTWHDDQNGRILQQLSGIGEIFARKLTAAGVKSLEDLDQLGPGKLESVIGRHTGGFGPRVVEELRSVPSFALQLSKSIIGKEADINLRISALSVGHFKKKFFSPIALIGSDHGGMILKKALQFPASREIHLQFHLKDINLHKKISIQVNILRLEMLCSNHVQVINKNFAGRDASLELVLCSESTTNSSTEHASNATECRQRNVEQDLKHLSKRQNQELAVMESLENRALVKKVKLLHSSLSQNQGAVHRVSDGDHTFKRWDIDRFSYKSGRTPSTSAQQGSARSKDPDCCELFGVIEAPRSGSSQGSGMPPMRGIESCSRKVLQPQKSVFSFLAPRDEEHSRNFDMEAAPHVFNYNSFFDEI
eukprot:755037-Hanusia_phi.AAC.2